MLQPRIAKREWDVVAQLAFQIQSRRIQGAADTLLESLLRSAGAAGTVERWYFVTFAIKCLQAVVPSPRVRRSVAIACAEAFVDIGSDANRHSIPSVEGLFEIYDLLRQVNAENRPSVASAYMEVIASVANGTDNERCLVALEAALTCANRFNHRVPEEWQTAAQNLIGGVKGRLLLFARSDFDLGVQCYYAGHVTLEDALEWHGPNILFRNVGFRTANWFYMPSGSMFLNALSNEHHRATERSDLSTIGNYVLDRAAPWVVGNGHRGPQYPYLEDVIISLLHSQIDDSAIGRLDSAGKFGVFALLATFIEASDENRRVRVFEALAKSTNPLITGLCAVLPKHFQTDAPVAPSLNLGDRWDRFVDEWAGGAITLFQRQEPAGGVEI